jgi:RNA polymerase sigma-70 factor, ECF subfamily
MRQTARVADGANVLEAALVDRLRRGDRDAFAELVRAHHASMVRVAESFVPNRAVAEDVVQDTWVGVIRGLARFEGRSSLRTWIFSILVNQARTRGVREARTEPVAALTDETPAGEPSVPPGRFTGPPGRGAWSTALTQWQDDPEIRLASRETLRVVEETLQQMPPQRRLVMVLRDIEGLTSVEVCDLLGLSEGNQRVLLHRARTQVRARLEQGGWR